MNRSHPGDYLMLGSIIHRYSSLSLESLVRKVGIRTVKRRPGPFWLLFRDLRQLYPPDKDESFWNHTAENRTIRLDSGHKLMLISSEHHYCEKKSIEEIFRNTVCGLYRRNTEWIPDYIYVYKKTDFSLIENNCTLIGTFYVVLPSLPPAWKRGTIKTINPVIRKEVIATVQCLTLEYSILPPEIRGLIVILLL